MWHSLARLLRHRVLIQTLVVRELKARYRGSVLGYLWTFVHPLLLLGVYTFVFTYVVQPLRGGETTEPYALFLFCGLLPWTWFSSALLEGSSSLISHGNLIKKILFPAEILPTVSVVHNGINFLIGLPIYLAFWIWFKPSGLSVHLLWLPLVIAVQLIFSLGLAYFLAAITVHYRDVRDLLANLLTLWFFATPIIYGIEYIEEGSSMRLLLDLNPMTHLLEGYHSAIFTGTMLHWRRFGVTAIVAVLTFVVGYWIFDRLRDSFAEEV